MKKHSRILPKLPYIFGVNLSFLLVFLSFCLFLLTINFLTPIMGEDIVLAPWPYHTPPSGFLAQANAVVHKIIEQSTQWNMRLGESLTIATAAFDKNVFNIMNTCVLACFMVLLFVYAFGRFPDWKSPKEALAILTLICLLLVFHPILGELFFWKSGVLNHTWGVAILLFFAVPYRLKATGNYSFQYGPIKTILYCAAGILAGITIENTGAIIIIMIISLLSWNFFIHKEKPTTASILGVIGLAIGVTILITAPSTTLRREYYATVDIGAGLSGLSLYIYRFKGILKDYIYSTRPALILLAGEMTILLFMFRSQILGTIRTRKLINHTLQNIFIDLAILLFSCIAIVALITVPYYAVGNRGIAFHWFILYTMIAYFGYEIWSRTNLAVQLFVAAISIFTFVSMAAEIYPQYLDLYQKAKQREDSLNSQIASGQVPIILDTLDIKRTRVLETREDWFLFNANTQLAKYYYQVDSILVQDPMVELSNIQPSKEIQYYFDNISVDQDYVIIRGWAVYPEHPDPEQSIYVQLRSVESHKDYFISSTPIEREDIGKAYGDPVYSGSGFNSRYFVDFLPAGEYQVGIVLENQGDILQKIGDEVINISTK